MDARRDSSSMAVVYGGASNSIERSVSHVKQIVKKRNKKIEKNCKKQNLFKKKRFPI